MASSSILCPEVRVEVAARTVAGLPLLASLELHNDSLSTVLLGLRGVTLLGQSLGPLALQLTDDHGRVTEVSGNPPEPGHPPALTGFQLRPGRRRRMLCDLGPALRLRAGVYTLTVRYRTPLATRAAPPVSFSVAAPEPLDTERLAELRAPARSWAELVRTTPAQEPDPCLLSAPAQESLALHLFLRRAVHGCERLAALDPGQLDALDQGVLQAEVAALRYELARARGVGAAAAPITERWPGLAWRLAAVDAGLGYLARLRRRFRARALV